MTVAVNRLNNGTIELTITVPWTEIKESYEKVIEQFVNETELPGFRKGKAPRNLVEEKLDKTKVYDQVLRVVVPKTYTEAVKQEKIVPIISPRVEIISFSENKDCQFKASTCEKPEVKLGDYQKAINELRQSKAAKIWTPGKDEKADEKPAGPTIDEILKVLLETGQVEIPSLLIEDESNRMLSRLIDQTQKLGMTVEQYLVSQAKTSESLRAEYAQQARQSLALEFILDAIAVKEQIEISDQEIEKIINETKDPKEKEALNQQKPYLALILKKQKTLDRLMKPIV